MAGVYRQRHPERSVFYRVLFHYFESFLLEYESRFEREYGYFRPIIQEVVDRYLDCGNPMCGFARIRCPDSGEERLLMFSCKTHGFCPSCGAQMRIIAFIEDPKAIDKIIRHLKLSFQAERPPPSQLIQQELLVRTEQWSEYF